MLSRLALFAAYFSVAAARYQVQPTANAAQGIIDVEGIFDSYEDRNADLSAVNAKGAATITMVIPVLAMSPPTGTAKAKPMPPGLSQPQAIPTHPAAGVMVVTSTPTGAAMSAKADVVTATMGAMPTATATLFTPAAPANAASTTGSTAGQTAAAKPADSAHMPKPTGAKSAASQNEISVTFMVIVCVLIMLGYLLL